MTRRAGLWRRIAIHMALVTLCGFSLAALCAFFLYDWVFENHPEAVASPYAWSPQTIDYLAIGASSGVAVLIALLVGMQLARRIVLPLNALAEAARRIARGDLEARAKTDDGSLGEVSGLVDDFNHMAQQLETLTNGMIAWNAAIAHELRTPVTILKGRLQGVADGVFQIDDRVLTSLLRQVDGLARLIEDLRVVSLSDTGHLDLRLEFVDLVQVVGELREAVDPGLIVSGFEPRWRLETSLTACDPIRIRQAVLALIENVRAHADKGAVVIRTGQEKGHVFVSVQDAGPGIPHDVQGAVFDSFYKLRSDPSGTGLGLAVVRAVAERHGGMATLEMNASGGSTFAIHIPSTDIAPPTAVPK